MLHAACRLIDRYNWVSDIIECSLFHFPLWRKANARNVRLYYLYRQYTNLLNTLIYRINSRAGDRDSCLAWCDAKAHLQLKSAGIWDPYWFKSSHVIRGWKLKGDKVFRVKLQWFGFLCNFLRFMAEWESKHMISMLLHVQKNITVLFG